MHGALSIFCHPFWPNQWSKMTCLNINQRLLFVWNPFLSSDCLYDVYFRIYGGSKEFHAINFRFLTPPPLKQALSILRYSLRLCKRSICMEIVLYRCEWTMEPRNGVFLQIWGHFLWANDDDSGNDDDDNNEDETRFLSCPFRRVRRLDFSFPLSHSNIVTSL